MLEEITPLILTFNEALNIDRTLQQLTWAKKIVIIDSYSTDETLKILQSYPQIEVFQREFDTFANQCNYGLQQIKSEWVISLDADYVVTDRLIAEIKTLRREFLVDGYFVKFKYCVFGKPLSGTLLPPREVLFRREKAIYVDDGHAHRVQVNGKSSTLSSYIHHDDRKPISRWFQAETKYVILEANKLLETPSEKLSFADKIRQKKVLAPFGVLLYCLIFKGNIFDGWAGWYYVLQRTLAEILLSIQLIQSNLSVKTTNSSLK